MKETDLYPAVKRFLNSQGYTVKSEIRNCDIVAVRGKEDPVVVELKNTLSLGVILQAIQRTTISELVYVAVPYNCPPLRTQRKHILKLFRMLGLGLLAVHLKSTPAIIEAILDPGPYRPRKLKKRKERLLREFVQRVGDPNQGGTNGRGGIMTAYRQKALRIANFLNGHGATKASIVAGEIGEPKTRDILYRNVYGWFERVNTGIYTLSPRGEQESQQWISVSPALIERESG
ncbi:MAG: hypothetical protein HKM93_00440 [Desulfobacteraceae bacterium]|nr:hypothetical protein [Desulfobacteraceae bacterium]